MSAAHGRAIDLLAAQLPRGAVSVADADVMAVSTDLWPRHLIRLARGETPRLPAAVVWPESTEQLQLVVQHARRHGLGLVPYGAGSSVVGGATPQVGQVVVDLKRMSRVLDIDAEALTATAQAGIMGELFERQLERRGFTQGHFPSSIYCSTLGGWIAAKSAGQMSSRYGKIEDQLLGGVVVLGDGRVLRQRPSPARDPLFDVLIGAEGSLGLWSEATVRIHRLPVARKWRGLMFPGVQPAVDAARQWLEAGLSPAVVRVYDPLDTLLHHQAHGEHVPHDRGPSRLAWVGAQLPRLTAWAGGAIGGKCMCVVGLMGEPVAMALEMGLVLDIAGRAGAKDLGPAPGEAWYERRYAVSYFQSRAFRAGVAVDTMEVACTWDRMVPVYEAVRAAALKSRAQVLAHFSHVYLEGGSIYFSYALPVAHGVEAYDALWRNCLRAARDAGANVSHHHGTGQLKAQALAGALGGARELWLSLQRRVDPERVLNPTLLSTRPQSGEAGPPPMTRWAVANLATAHPDERLGALERRLRGQGQTLGDVAALLAETTVLEAARGRWLWRRDPQLRLIEPALAGVDARVGGEPHRFIPAPRAAMGPCLAESLLEAEVERLWVRTSPASERGLRYAGTVEACVAAARAVVRDESCGNARVAVWTEGLGAALELWLPAGARGELTASLVPALVVPHLGDSPEPARAAAPLAGTPLFVAGTWRVIEQLLLAVRELGFAAGIAWADAAGAAGFLHAGERPLTDEERERLLRLAREKGAVPEAAIEPAPERPGSHVHSLVRPRPPRAGEISGKASISKHAHVGELDNCTYCPKLCRFSCPVATADGNDALIPRQLMLTANLHRTGRQRLTPDVAERLWSCVDCRGCRSFCDHANDVAETLQSVRADLWSSGLVPPQVRAYLKVLLETGRPPQRPASDSPAAALDGDGPGAGTWLFLGCEGSLADPQPARAALHLARKRFGAVHVLDGNVGCCGHPLWRWGDREGFARHARAFAAQLQGARRVVVDDPGCAYALRSLYPRVGVQVPEVLTTSMLLRLERWRPVTDTRYALHDDEFATRWLGEPTLRNLVDWRQAPPPAGSVIEGAAGSCGGMLLPVYDAELARRAAQASADDLLGTGAARILTASPACRRRLREVGAPVDDLLQLWFALTF